MTDENELLNLICRHAYGRLEMRHEEDKIIWSGKHLVLANLVDNGFDNVSFTALFDLCGLYGSEAASPLQNLAASAHPVQVKAAQAPLTLRADSEQIVASEEDYYYYEVYGPLKRTDVNIAPYNGGTKGKAIRYAQSADADYEESLKKLISRYEKEKQQELEEARAAWRNKVAFLRPVIKRLGKIRRKAVKGDYSVSVDSEFIDLALQFNEPSNFLMDVTLKLSNLTAEEFGLIVDIVAALREEYKGARVYYEMENK